jgi:hypothetical protein
VRAQNETLPIGKPIQRQRWTIGRAAGEFPVDSKTLAKRIKLAGIEPGEDGKFSTEQICRATFGDLRGEQTRETKERADKLALANEKERGRLLDAEKVYKHYEGVFVTLRQKTLASAMTDDEKDELLNDLRALKSRIFSD